MRNDGNRGGPATNLQRVPVIRQPVSMQHQAVVPLVSRAQQEEPPDLGDTLRSYLSFLHKYKGLIAASMLVCTALGGLYALMKPPLYTAATRIQIDRQSVQVVEGGATTVQETSADDFMRTQYALLASRSMAERVASRLSLESDKNFFEPRNISLVGLFQSVLWPRSEPQGASSAERQKQAAGMIMEDVVIRPLSGSRLVDISFTDPVPFRAMRIANAYADAYIASNIDKRFQANNYARTFLEDQIKQLKIRLEDSEKALFDFAEREKIIATNENASNAEANLAAANVALGELISQRIKNEQLWRQIAASGKTALPQFLSNSVIEELRGQRKTLKKEYEEKLETFKPSYPAMRQITKKVREIDRQRSAEIKTIRASLRAAYENAASQENEMRRRVETLRSQVLKLQKKQIQYNTLKREVDSNRQLYKGLLKRFKEVDVAGGVGANNVFVVDSARIPTRPSQPHLSRALLLSLMLGLGAGVSLALAREVLDDRIYTPEDIEHQAGLPTIGVIPAIKSSEQFARAQRNPRSAVTEAYRTLGTALQFSSAGGMPRSVMVTSTGPGEGKSSTSVAIARHFATLGSRVLIVDGDLREPSLHIWFGGGNPYGLSDVLTGAAKPAQVIRPTNNPNLAFMSSGPLPLNAVDLLGGVQLKALISSGLTGFDLVVIDAPPMLGLADAQLLSNAVSASVFVVASGSQRKAAVRDAIGRLKLTRASLVGVVLTKFDSRAGGYGDEWVDGYSQPAYGSSEAIDDGSRRLKIP